MLNSQEKIMTHNNDPDWAVLSRPELYMDKYKNDYDSCDSKYASLFLDPSSEKHIHSTTAYFDHKTYHVIVAVPEELIWLTVTIFNKQLIITICDDGIKQFKFKFEKDHITADGKQAYRTFVQPIIRWIRQQLLQSDLDTRSQTYDSFCSSLWLANYMLEHDFSPNDG